MRPVPEFEQSRKLLPVRVLLIEDDESFAGLVRNYLALAAWGDLRLESVATLALALRALAGRDFDLILADLNLPDSRGLETVDALARASDRLIIAVTGDLDAGLREAAIARGAYDLLSKGSLDRTGLERLVRLGAMQASTFRSLRESEARLKAIINAEPECVKILNAEGNLLEMNPAGLRMIEADDLESLRGQSVLGLVAPEHRDAFRRLTQRVMRGESGTLEFEIIGLKGTRRWLETNAVPLREEGSGRQQLLGITRDITERKRATDELRRFRLAMDMSADMVTLIDCESMRYLDVNTTACEMTGFSREEMMRMGPQDTSQIALEDLRGTYRDIIASGKIHAAISTKRRKDGTLVPVEIHRRALPSEGRWLMLATVRDISTRVQSEEALRLSELRFRKLTELSSDWYWEQDEHYRFTDVSSAAFALNDNHAVNVLGKTRWESSFDVEPDFWRSHKEDLEAHRPFRDLELPRRIDDGTLEWVSVSGEPIFDRDENFKGYRGIGRNITALKNEEAILELEHNVARCLAEADSVQSGMEAVLRATCESHGWEVGRYWRADTAREVMCFGGAWAASAETLREAIEGSRDVIFSPGAGLVGEVCRTGEPLWVADASQDPRVLRSDLWRGGGARGAFVVPILSGANAIGALSFTSSLLRQPQQRLLDAMRVIGVQLGQFVRRKDAERALRESEVRFRSLTTLFTDWYWEQDAELRFTRVDGRMAEATGNRPNEAIGLKCWELPSITPLSCTWEEHRATLVSRQPFRDFEYSRIHANGRVLYTSVSGEPIYDDAGQFSGYRGISSDISARKREERLLRLEHDVARALAGAATISEGLQAALASICLSEGYQCGRVFCLDDSGESMAMLEGWCDGSPGMRAFMEGSRSTGMKLGEGLVGVVWETKAPLWIHDVTLDPRVKHAALAEAAGVHGASVYPVMSEGRILGAFSISSHEVREPDERELGCMVMIGSQIGQFIRGKRADDEQRASRQLLDNIVENIPTAVQLKTANDGRIKMWNKAAEAIFGVPRSEAIGKTVYDLWPDAAAGPMYQADARLVDTGGMQEFRDRAALTRDRGDIRVHMRKVTLQDISGKTSHLLIVADDITERQREERLLALEHLVSRILAEGDDPLQAIRKVIQSICEAAGWDGGRYFALDPAAGAMRFQESWSNGKGPMERFIAETGRVGYARGEGLIGLAWDTGDLQWADDAANDPRVARAALMRDTGLRSSFAFPVHFEGKVCGVLSISSSEAREADGRFLKALAVIGSQMGQFLTRRQAEQALIEGEARFRQTFEIAATGIAHVGLDGTYLRVNRKLCEILGYSEEELLGRSVKDLSHPEDRDVLDAALARMRRGEVRSARGDKRYMHKDGSVVWVELTVALARDAAGTPLYDISIIEDFTERKAAEDALRRFRAALDGSADMVLLADLTDLRLIDFNGTACSYLGYERQELLGMKPGGYLVEVEESQLRESFQGLVASPGRADSVVQTFRRKDGRTFSAEVLRRVIESPDGSILVLNARDLTERNLAAERQALYVRYQENIARFGESALGRREATELIEDAVQTAFEALPGAVIAYVEPAEAERTLTLRSLAGATRLPERPAHAVYASNHPLALALEHGELAVAEGEGTALPFEWAKPMRGVAIAPVHGDHRVLGALCAASGAEFAFGAEESKFLATVASVLSAGLRRIESEGRLAFLAQFDALTGLPNRALLSDRFSQKIVQARRHATPLGVLFIDLDDFKLVNDTLGHAGGDDLLREMGRRLQSVVRPGDTVARISGDEFAVILGDLAQPEDAALVAQKIIDRLGAAVVLRGQEVFVTASIGIAAFPADGDDAETLLGAADAAMYRAKQSGRNSFQFFTADINQRSRARAQLGSELRRALERGEFMLAYQAKFDLRSGKPCAAEALLRWNHPERGVVSPAEFIPVLEETGLIVAAGEWVLRRACMDIRAWQAAGMRPLPVAVNLSARQFRQQDLDASIRSIMDEHGVAPELIDLEITESQLMHDPEHAQRMMRSLSEIGIRIAIDDFGTGYSSLSYLTRFPVSALKIDRSFVADVMKDRADAAIVRTIIDMAHTLGFIVIAEGVETEAQALLLRSLGCEQAQGYYFARPMPAAELMAVIFAATGAGSVAEKAN